MSDTPRAEQELQPADPAGWRCESCARVFELELLRVD